MKPKKTEPEEGSGQDADRAGLLLSRQVAELRKKKGWTLEQLSAACGVSRSMLSQIERNQVNPTLVVTLRIAQAFGISLGKLLNLPDTTSAIDVIRAEDKTFHFRRTGDCSIRTLSPLNLEKDVEFYELILKPGGELRSAPHFAGAREILTVQQGTLQVSSGEEQCELHDGDSAHYAADVTHAIINSGRSDATAFLVVIYRPS